MKRVVRENIKDNLKYFYVQSAVSVRNMFDVMYITLGKYNSSLIPQIYCSQFSHIFMLRLAFNVYICCSVYGKAPSHITIGLPFIVQYVHLHNP